MGDYFLLHECDSGKYVSQRPILHGRGRTYNMELIDISEDLALKYISESLNIR